MQIDFATLSSRDRYKLMIATIVPRPVAWVTTISEAGVVNAAPFSFFNVFSEAPPLVVIGINGKPDGTPKDTARHIRASGEFVVNIADRPLCELMVATASRLDVDESEPALVGLATSPSLKVAPPRLAAAPVAFECRRTVILEFGSERQLLIGEVLAMHARHGLVDPSNWHVDWGDSLPVARMHGDAYAELGPSYHMPVPDPMTVRQRASNS